MLANLQDLMGFPGALLVFTWEGRHNGRKSMLENGTILHLGMVIMRAGQKASPRHASK